MKLFEMKHIKKSFGSLEVLKDISLSVEEGEVLSIIGPSGSGKSTLLRCATGLETPDSGEIIKQGEVGLVFQNFNLFPHFSVLKNITDAPIRVQKRKKEEVYAQARSSAETDGTGRQGECISVPAFRRSAAEGFHCKSPLHEPEDSVL